MKIEPQTQHSPEYIQVVRHAQVCRKLQISSAKLYDMVARQQFPPPFPLVPGGRAVGWIEKDVDLWILKRKDSAEIESALRGFQ